MTELTRVLCPVDFSEASSRALGCAARICAWSGAKLRVVHVMPPMPPSAVSELAAASRALARKNLDALVERCRLPGVDIDTALIESAEPAPRILECADDFDAGLIVAGSHGRSGVARVLLGSVIEALLHRSVTPILAVPANLDTLAAPTAQLSRILCGVDFADASLNAARIALSIADKTNARLTLLHVIDIPPELSRAPAPLDRFVAPLRAQSKTNALQQLNQLIAERGTGGGAEAVVLEGKVVDETLRLAGQQHADLIVAGVHGRNALDLTFFGSNTKTMIAQARCPVLVVPASRRAEQMKRQEPK